MLRLFNSPFADDNENFIGTFYEYLMWQKDRSSRHKPKRFIIQYIVPVYSVK